MSEIKLCSTCHVHPVKYRCPACQATSCSLECTKEHKAKTKCSGKRSRIDFVPRSKMDETSLNNDYNFLTTVERDLDNAARHSMSLRHGRPQGQVNAFVKRAKEVCEVTVLPAPRGLLRSKRNKSCWIAKKQCISWTVEIFVNEVRTVLDRNLDTVILGDLLRPSIQADEDLRSVLQKELKVLIRNEGLGATSKATYATLNQEDTLKAVLRNRVVIEFPAFYVYKDVPEHLKMEKKYVYVLPSTQAIKPSLDLPKQGNDFIAFNMSSDSSSDSETDSTNSLSCSDTESHDEHADEDQPRKKVSLFGLT